MSNVFKQAAIAAIAMFGMVGCAVQAQPARHPAYLHALSDLRFARALLEHGSGDKVMDEEVHAIEQIDAAIGEIKRASYDDGKDLHDHPPIDAGMRRAGRFHRALEVLDKAQHDIEHEEDDPNARGLRNRAVEHIQRAHHSVEHAIAVAFR